MSSAADKKSSFADKKKQNSSYRSVLGPGAMAAGPPGAPSPRTRASKARRQSLNNLNSMSSLLADQAHKETHEKSEKLIQKVTPRPGAAKLK